MVWPRRSGTTRLSTVTGVDAVRRYIITGAPGAGKTTVLATLRAWGYAVVDEAATDVIAGQHALGRDDPWYDPGFLDAVAELQRQRQEQPPPPGVDIQLYDRSPICTLALAHYGRRPVTPVLAREVERIVGEQVYQPRVFFVHLLGFVTPTAARRISFAQSVRFEGIHRRAYHAHGYQLVHVPAGTVEERAALIDRYIRSWSR